MDAKILLHYLFVPNKVGMLPLFANFYSSVGSTYTIQWKVNIIYVLNTAGSSVSKFHYQIEILINNFLSTTLQHACKM